MSFSTSFCITNTGIQSLGESLEVYGDSDSYVSLITTVSLSDITGSNCPYTITVPDNTNRIKIFDPVSTCYVILRLESNDVCDICDLGFDDYSSNSIGRLTAGNLTGTCTFTDYRINWYRNGDFSSPIFTSGKGTLFAPYKYTHPLVGPTSLFTLEGVYTPVVDKIGLDGLVFSNEGYPGTIKAVLDCFNDQSLTVIGFTCDNGGTSSNLTQYSHRVQFQGQSSAGVIPQPLTSSFKLKSTTKYFAWKFKGESVPDKLKLTLLGASYPVPIILEYWDVGGGIYNSSVSPQTLPKSASTSNYLTKVTCLTGLTINDNDLIIMEISPNTGNTQTNWDFYFTCLESFNGTYCDNPLPYKLIKSSITGITASCDRIYVNFTLSGACTDLTGFNNSDVNKYLPINSNDYSTNGRKGPYQTSQLYLNGKTCYRNNFNYNQTCSLPTTNTIKYIKTPGLFRIECSSISDISNYYNSYNLTKTSYELRFSYSSTTNDYRYYASFSLDYPNSTGNSNCGDGTSKRTLYFHTSSQVTTGNTSGIYWMELTMPTISNGMTYTTCDQNCTSNTNNVVSVINQSSTGTSFNYTGTTNTGSKYVEPIKYNNYLTETDTPSIYQEMSENSNISNYLNETYPFSASSPTTYTLIPTLSGATWSNIDSYFYVTDPTPVSVYYRYFYYRYVYYLKFTLFNPLDYRDYKIESRIISPNGQLSNYELAYVFSGGTEQYWNPAYVIDA